MTTKFLLQQWAEGRIRFSNLLPAITAADLSKKLAPAPNSIGFLMRHIAEVELLYAKNIFKAPNVKVIAKTVIEKQDNGQWTNLEELINLQQYAYKQLQEAIALQSDDSWDEKIATKEFGERTKAEALGRITTHTAYHTGQIALILKYGQ
ncbi:DinB family protein [Pontibacter ruber]|uniref:DinB family protein n=1 Tax=Pontibacter ruber TaxID=1343895 RepID=A0ABW5D1B8_9BACT|nr:DinB family protein [Pontibacter ruber]